MGGKEYSHEQISGLADVLVKVSILYHHNFGLYLIWIDHLFYPATYAICVAGSAHHV